MELINYSFVNLPTKYVKLAILYVKIPDGVYLGHLNCKN